MSGNVAVGASMAVGQARGARHFHHAVEVWDGLVFTGAGPTEELARWEVDRAIERHERRWDPEWTWAAGGAPDPDRGPPPEPEVEPQEADVGKRGEFIDDDYYG